MQILSVDKVDSISREDFNRNYLRPQKPLIIRGLANSQPAGKKWTVDYLREVCGDVMIDVFDNRNANHGSAYTVPDGKMRFRDFLDISLREEPTTLRMFLFNMFAERPQLRADFPCPGLIKGMLGKIGFMFFGAKGIKVRIHQDMDMSNVMLTQFQGRKRVMLVAPEYSRLLYKLPFNTHSLIDLDNPDLDKYPGLRYIKVYDCMLEPGETLFMPSGYWHYITYVDSGFAVSYRKMANSPRWMIRGLVSLFVYMPFDKLMNRVFGESWISRKEKMAHARAQREIRKIKGDSDGLKTETLTVELH
jgi:hypothetical protein